MPFERTRGRAVLLALFFGAMLGLAWAPGRAAAQPPKADQFTEKTKKPDELPKKSETLWTATLGAVLNLGNTRSWTVNGGTNFRLVRGRHAFTADASINYGQADLPDDEPDRGFVDTARNVNLKARYDLFFTEMDAVFVAAAYRWDTFAGLDARVQGQVGYLRNFFKEDEHRFWGEVGYDLTYDNYDPDPLPDPNDPTMFLDGDAIVHSARLFLGYDNHLNDAVTFLTGLEALFDLQDGKDVRLNWDATLSSKIAKKLALDVKVSVKFDNVPVPGKEKTDFTTQLNLVYQLI